ncbi:Non-specific serine/threonine protein kinase protein [Dioscorea alata]|uniref:Non-specific serine/threonine protein kinase protein n=1 Tax=Dioscorea alata TaxID=55571 RepID=A0ACB7WQ04_DIOAL|nr:Non-specific serine/threonine protein kinase protein [Dioscorea alata]
MSWSLAVIAGVAAGGLALVFIGLFFLWFYIFKSRALSSKTSETGSSYPSALVEWNRGARMCSDSSGPSGDCQSLRQFTLQELELAVISTRATMLARVPLVWSTKGCFLMVHLWPLKGVLVIQCKSLSKRAGSVLIQDSASQSGYAYRLLPRRWLSSSGYEYIPNGSISVNLYDIQRDPTVRLEFKQRLSIALGAAKGLSHLHSLVPPVIHKGFKTSNVLVNENFIAKVADTGMVELLQRIEDGCPSQTSESNLFQDPEIPTSEELREASDVYSFGVFLLELVAGREVALFISHESTRSLAHWCKLYTTLKKNADIYIYIFPLLGKTWRSNGFKSQYDLSSTNGICFRVVGSLSLSVFFLCNNVQLVHVCSFMQIAC